MVRVIGKVTIWLCWAVEKIGSAELVGINGGEEMDDCMARFDECNTGTEGSACDRRYKIVDSCAEVKPQVLQFVGLIQMVVIWR